MKRLLLPLLAALALPTAVNADIRKIPEALRQSFSKDTLILETKVGETIEIKKSTVEIINSADQSYLISTAKRSIKEYYRKSREYLRETNQENLIEKERIKEKRRIKAGIGYIEEFSPKSELHILSFSFIPIFTDLNGKKSVLQKEYVECINPVLPIGIIDMWEYVYQRKLNYLDSKYVDFVCEKYAKFKR